MLSYFAHASWKNFGVETLITDRSGYMLVDSFLQYQCCLAHVSAIAAAHVLIYVYLILSSGGRDILAHSRYRIFLVENKMRG